MNGEEKRRRVAVTSVGERQITVNNDTTFRLAKNMGVVWPQHVWELHEATPYPKNKEQPFPTEDGIILGVVRDKKCGEPCDSFTMSGLFDRALRNETKVAVSDEAHDPDTDAAYKAFMKRQCMGSVARNVGTEEAPDFHRFVTYGLAKKKMEDDDICDDLWAKSAVVAPKVKTVKTPEKETTALQLSAGSSIDGGQPAGGLAKKSAGGTGGVQAKQTTACKKQKEINASEQVILQGGQLMATFSKAETYHSLSEAMIEALSAKFQKRLTPTLVALYTEDHPSAHRHPPLSGALQP